MVGIPLFYRNQQFLPSFQYGLDYAGITASDIANTALPSFQYGLDYAYAPQRLLGKVLDKDYYTLVYNKP
jgi:hypothetical protein